MPAFFRLVKRSFYCSTTEILAAPPPSSMKKILMPLALTTMVPEMTLGELQAVGSAADLQAGDGAGAGGNG